MKQWKILSLLTASLFLLLKPPLILAAGTDSSNSTLMNATIVGAIGSLGFACFLGKPPCSLSPGINTKKLTLSADAGADNTVNQVRLALGADWKETLWENDHFIIDGRWEINTNFWESSQSNPVNKNGVILGLTPVFHYSPKNIWANPYFELGGGPQLMSNTYLENENKSTQFQFGSILGFGVSNKYLEVGYRYLHISNANIELPNPGTDFHNIHLGIKF